MHELIESLADARAELNTQGQKIFINNTLRYMPLPDVFISQAYNLHAIREQVEPKDFLYAGLIVYTPKNELLDYFCTTGPRDFVMDQLKIGMSTIRRHWEDETTNPSLDFRVARVTDPEKIRQTKEFLEGFHKATTGNPLPANYWKTNPSLS